MRRPFWLPLLVLAACHRAPAPLSPVAFALPDSTALVDGPTGASVATAELLRRVGSADLVLLGEVHDNPVAHAVRGSLLRALGSRRPAVVFEQFAASEGPIARPAAGESLTVWLDRNGFDRRGWRWPLHEPVRAVPAVRGAPTRRLAVVLPAVPVLGSRKAFIDLWLRVRLSRRILPVRAVFGWDWAPERAPAPGPPATLAPPASSLRRQSLPTAGPPT